MKAMEMTVAGIMKLMIAAQTGGFLERLAALTGHGVVPGVPPHPVFTVRFPTMQERAARREQRKRLAKGSDSGCTAPDQVAN
jgi:hypothetical protein